MRRCREHAIVQSSALENLSLHLQANPYTLVLQKGVTPRFSARLARKKQRFPRNLQQDHARSVVRPSSRVCESGPLMV